MRLLLDAHVSAAAIGGALRERGHDVLALAERPDLEGLADPDVLALAADDERVLMTFDVKDFAPLLRDWAEAGRAHAGCILVAGIDHAAFGHLLRGLDALFPQRPDQRSWLDLCVVLASSP